MNCAKFDVKSSVIDNLIERSICYILVSFFLDFAYRTDVPRIVKKFHETVESVKVTSTTRVDQRMKPPPAEFVGSARRRNAEQLKSYEEAGE
jgi:hypothetical protein